MVQRQRGLFLLILLLTSILILRAAHFPLAPPSPHSTLPLRIRTCCCVSIWNKIRIWERDRFLGLLFFGASLVVVAYILLVLSYATAARAVGAVALFYVSVRVLVRFLRYWRSRKLCAPVGPLSRDERNKARSKLLKPKPEHTPRS